MAVSSKIGLPWRRPTGASLLLIGSAPLLAFLLAPTLIVTPMALTKGNIIQFPPVWISVHAFTDYLSDPEWMADTLVSLKIAVLATLVACAVGTSTALALFHLRGPVRGAVSSVVMLPMMAPVIVLALGDYLALSRVGLVGNWPMIAMAHSLLGAPYVVLSVQTSLGGLNQALVRSARSLGAGDLAVLRHVYWPAIRPGLLAGAVFAFYGSFDEVILALFLQGPGVVTLPVQMFTSIQYELTPKIAAVSALLVFLAAAALIGQGLLTRVRGSANSSAESSKA
jgi:putative spermidine/putrescine transport system permease protein